MDAVLRIALLAIPAILAITLHEAAHGYAALALGDDTARQAGRLSLNPLRHVDRVGTIIVPGLMLLVESVTHSPFFVFGWAKPVPVAAWKFRDPRRGMALVAVAGPAMNFLLAWLAALLMSAPYHAIESAEDFEIFLIRHPFTAPFMLFNLFLGLFNLLPIPPLDGGRIAVGLLPLDLARRWAQVERYGIVLVIALVFLLPRIFPGFDPFGDALDTVMPWAVNLLLPLTGHDIGGTDVQL
jgi:Zn-dependent protease